MRSFADLSEREVLALATASEEEDGRVSADFAQHLREHCPGSMRRRCGRSATAAGLGMAACAMAFAEVARAQPASNPVLQGAAPAVPRSVIVRASDNTPAKLDHILPEVAGAKIAVTKKSDVAKLDQAAPIHPDAAAPRELFAHMPGVLVSEQQTLTQFNFNYRGLGDPQASESILALQDGLPISADWIGAPVLAFLPLAPGLSEVQLVRAGSGLLYGPQASAINLVSRRPGAGAPRSASFEQIGGSDGAYSSYGAVEGSSGPWRYRAQLGYVATQGERRNGSSHVGEGDVYLGYAADGRRLWYLDAHLYGAQSGDPGRIGYAQFKADPSVASTPFNSDRVSRYALTLGNETDFGGGLKFEGKLWYAYQDLASRTAASQAPGGPPPRLTTLQDQLFRSEGVDLRLVQRYGRGDAFTLGAVAYHDNAPLRQWTDPDLQAARSDPNRTPILRQARATDYGAIFAENVFRLPKRVHLVPSVRLERETERVGETLRPPALSRPLIDVRVGHTVPLFGIGVGNDFGRQNETYFSVTQGYRPVRFLDIASPYRDTTGTKADPSRSVSYEAGVHGTPLKGLFYDAGMFWIEVHDRVETLALSPIEIIAHVTGDTRERGFEGEIAYDLIARPGAGRLRAFANLSLLDARFTSSATPGQIGKVPAYAPHVLARYGLTWRGSKRYEASLTALSVGSQYWQDSDAAGFAAGALIPARIAAHSVVDLDLDYRLSRRVKLLFAATNFFDQRYTSRIYQDGVEPALGRQLHGGLALAF